MEGVIYKKLVAVQADVDFIGKDKQVQSGGTYKYRGVDQVLNTLHPLFARHGVFAVPEVLEILTREQRTTSKGASVVYQVLKVRYTFFAEDGSSVSAVVVGEAMDSGDKVSNKCMSVAYKYACFQILSIPTEETASDPDDTNDELTARNSPAKATKDGAVKKCNPLTEEEILTYGVTDAAAAVAWLSEKLGKPLSEFTDEEADAARGLLKRRKAARERARKAWDESAGVEIPF